MAKLPLQHNPQNCYVYTITVDGVVRYVGKGTKYRISRHIQAAERINANRAAGRPVKALKFHNRLAKAMRTGSVIESRKIISGLTSAEALEREIKEILSAPDGQLWNETSGGDGIDSSFANKLWADPDFREKMLAIRRSEKFRENARQRNIAHFADQEARNRSRDASIAMWSSPEFKERGTKALRAIWDSAEIRDRHKKGIARAWDEHPDRRLKRAALSKIYGSKPENRRRVGELFKRLWKDPEFRKKATSHWSNPDRKKAIVESWTPEFLAKRGRAISEGLAKSEAMKRLRADPSRMKNLAEKSRNYWRLPEARAKHSEKMRALWADPEYRAKTTAHWAEKRKALDGRS